MVRLNQKAAEAKAADANKKIKQHTHAGEPTAAAQTVGAATHGKKDEKKSVKGQPKAVTDLDLELVHTPHTNKQTNKTMNKQCMCLLLCVCRRRQRQR